MEAMPYFILMPWPYISLHKRDTQGVMEDTKKLNSGSAGMSLLIPLNYPADFRSLLRRYCETSERKRLIDMIRAHRTEIGDANEPAFYIFFYAKTQ